MNVNGAACRDAVMVRSIPMWAFSRDSKSVMSVLMGEWAKIFPITAGVNRTLFRFMRLLRPSTHCESSSTWDMRAAFRCRGLSIRPLDVGFHAVLRVREDSVIVDGVLKRPPSIRLPWSSVICWRQPKRATQTETAFLLLRR